MTLRPLTWSDDLKLGVDVIDDDHARCFALTKAAQDAGDADFPAAFGALVDFIHEHFAHENALMDRTGFFAAHCHKAEHQRVLDHIDALRAEAEAGQPAMARMFADEGFAAWFFDHHGTMDLVTARFCRAQAATV